MTDPRHERTPGEMLASPGPSSASRPGASRHFWVGVVIFVVVAAAYPFYAHHVNARLAARDAAAFAPPVEPSANPPPVKMTAAEERQAAIEASKAAAPVSVALPAGVTVVGTTLVGRKRTVIADLAGMSLDEAKGALCKQAAAQFRQSMSGENLTVQRYRDNDTPEDLGAVVCD